MENQQTQPAQPIQSQPGKGLAVASMVLGIVAVLTGLIYLGAVLGILAIIFGVIALKKKAGKGMAIAGIITGSLGILGTIIAISLVLIAVPALQRSARDTDRKNQLGLIVSEIQNYQANNQGALPDPNELSETVKTGKLDISANGEPATDVAVYKVGEDCEGVMRSRVFKVSVKLENGQIYCHGS